jgi:hypothetical protein
MADNVTLPGPGELVATDQVGANHYQLIKLADGTADSATPAVVRTTNPAPTDGGLVVRQAPEDVWQASFSRVNGSALDEPVLTQRRLGTGVGVSQSGGNLLVTTGTGTNAEFLARSTTTFKGALIQRHKTILSQRIANQNFAILLADLIAEGAACTINSATSISVTKTAHGLTSANVGQSMFVGAISAAAAGVPGRYAIASIPDANTINFTVAGWPASGSCTVDLFGWNHFKCLYNGVSATSALVDAQRNGWASGDTTATISTTASPGHVMQLHADGRNCYWSDTLVASTTTPTVTTRASRVEILPDDDIPLYLYIWSYNGTSAPASTTTWTVGFVSVEDLANVPVYVAGFRPQGAQAPIAVTFPSGQSVNATQTGTWNVTVNAAIAAGTNAIGDFGVQYRGNATGAGTIHNVASPLTPAGTSVKGSAGRIVGYNLVNTSAGVRWLKIFNATSVTMGTTSAVIDIPIPAGASISWSAEGGIGFATGIQWAVTSARGATDNTTTGLALGDVCGFISYA